MPNGEIAFFYHELFQFTWEPLHRAYSRFRLFLGSRTRPAARRKLPINLPQHEQKNGIY